MHAVKVGTCCTCTHAVCTHRPMDCCNPAHMLRTEVTSIVTILATSFEKVKAVVLSEVKAVVLSEGKLS